MPPTLLLIRHAEAEHNATHKWHLIDPPLTRKGLQQCKDLQEHLRKNCPLALRIERIITSPMRRTCQTTLTALDWLIKNKVPIEVKAMWQENSDENCDTGSNLKSLSKLFPQLDFSPVDPVYPEKSGIYAYTRQANHARGQACLQDLYGRPEKVIAVISHAGFLRTGISKRRYANADFRIFTFGKGKGGEGDEDGGMVLELVEDEETEGRGGGMGRSEKGVQEVNDWDFPPETPEDEDDDDDGDYVD